jgi:hypothetical protein
MPKKPDPLDNLSPDQQSALLRGLVFNLFGEENGGAVWKQMEPALRSKARQIGDAPEPEKNFWRGAWKIYEID